MSSRLLKYLFVISEYPSSSVADLMKPWIFFICGCICLKAFPVPRSICPYSLLELHCLQVLQQTPLELLGHTQIESQWNSIAEIFLLFFVVCHPSLFVLHFSFISDIVPVPLYCLPHFRQCQMVNNVISYDFCNCNLKSAFLFQLFKSVCIFTAWWHFLCVLMVHRKTWNGRICCFLSSKWYELYYCLL